MTPVPKGLSKLGVLRWRRAVERGASPAVARAAAKGQIFYGARAGSDSADHGFVDYPSDANSLDRNTRGVE